MRAPVALLALVPAALAGDDRPERRVDVELQGRINTAISKGIAYLKSIQQPDGSWPYARGGTDATAGLTALSLYALAASKVDASDETIRKGLRWADRNKASYPEGSYATYSASLLVLALTRIDPERHRTRIHRLADAIVAGQLATDLWTYRLEVPGTKEREPARARVRGDNSNSQFAVLALWAASALAGYEVPSRTWQRIQAFYTRSQLADGGWGYVPGPDDLASRPSMTSAGLCSCVYATAALLGGVSALPAAREDPIARRGLKALLDDPGRRDYNDYYLVYALERAGTVMAIPPDLWYVEGARALVAQQRESGRWGPGGRFGDAQSAYETSLALLFLARATGAVITPGGDVDRERRRAAFPARVGPGQLDEALAYYLSAPEAERKTLAPRFAEAGAEAVGFLVGKLRAPERGTRGRAYELLEALVSKRLLFDPGASAEERDLMLAPIEAFWRDEGAALRWDDVRRRFVSP
jgi:hypothetical protein